MDIQQRMQHLLYEIAESVVVVCHEEKNKSSSPSPSSVCSLPRRLLLPLLHNHSIVPVSSLSPSPSSSIVQLRVLKQKKNDSCGYYALYNVLTAAAAITSHTEEEALKYTHQLRERTRFWVSYNNIIHHLHKRADSSIDSKYPWTREHIDKGILERPYIQYLMNSKLIPSNIDITVLSDFSMMGMKHNILPISDLHKLAQIFASYNPSKGEKRASDESEEGDKIERSEKEGERVSDESENRGDGTEGNGEGSEISSVRRQTSDANQGGKLHAFLVGQACHWISFICNKVGDKVEVLVFDSRNHNLLTSSHEEFLRIVNKTKKKIPEWKKEIYMCSLREPKMTADLFHDCVMGLRDVITSLLEHNMDGFLSSFEEHVEKSEMKDMWLVPLMAWLEMYWPPPVVESNIIKVLQALGVSKLSPVTRGKFLRMVRLLREGINFGECDIPVVQRFEAVVLWMEVAFSVPNNTV